MVPIQNKSLFGTSLNATPAPQGKSLNITDPQSWLTPRWGEQVGVASSLMNTLSGLGYKGTNYGNVQDINQLASAAGMDQNQLAAFISQLEQQNGKQFLQGNSDQYVRSALQGRATTNEVNNWLNQNGYKINTQDTGSLQIQDLFDPQGNKIGSDTFDYQSFLNKENKAVNTTAIVTALALAGGMYFDPTTAAGAAGSSSAAGGAGGVGGLGGSAGGAAYLPAGAYNPAIGNTIGAYSAGASGATGTGLLGGTGAVGSVAGGVSYGAAPAGASVVPAAATGSIGAAPATGYFGGSGGLGGLAGGSSAYNLGTSSAASAANAGGSGMDWMDWAEKGVNLGSKLYDSKNAKDAASQLAASQAAAGQAAAEEARFRPIGVTNAFGSSNFKFDPTTGRLSEAGYTVDPKLAALRDQLLGLAGTNSQQLGQANQAYLQGQQGLFGSVANAGDIQGQTQRLFQQRQDLLAPQRERDLANLRNQSYQAGRSGLAVGGTSAGDYAAANPEMQAFFNAQRQKDNELLAGAEQDARNYRSNDISTLASLFSGQSGSLQPLLQMLQGSGGIEEMGRSGFDLGMALGGRNANPTGANALMSGLSSAAQSNMAATNYQNAGYSSLFGGLADLFKEYNKKPKEGSTG